MPDRLSLALAAAISGIAFAGCAPVPYDFVPGGGVGDDGCELDIEDSGCPVGQEICSGWVTVHTVTTEKGAGCTPAGLALAGVAFPAGQGSIPVDLYAWLDPLLVENRPFRADSSLALFGDPCGDAPLGGTLDCDYEPWIFVEGLEPGHPLYLHVQTSAINTVHVGYEIRPSDSWARTLPEAGEAIDCNWDLESDLVYTNPWTGHVGIALDAYPPPGDDEPFICGHGSAGWRQVGFLLRNAYESDILVRRIRLWRGDDAAMFHFALLRCGENGLAVLATDALASSCADSGLDPSKDFEATLVPWVPVEVETEYVLVLQVPPSAGSDVALEFPDVVVP